AEAARPGLAIPSLDVPAIGIGPEATGYQVGRNRGRIATYEIPRHLGVERDTRVRVGGDMKNSPGRRLHMPRRGLPRARSGNEGQIAGLEVDAFTGREDACRRLQLVVAEEVWRAVGGTPGDEVGGEELRIMSGRPMLPGPIEQGDRSGRSHRIGCGGRT